MRCSNQMRHGALLVLLLSTLIVAPADARTFRQMGKAIGKVYSDNVARFQARKAVVGDQLKKRFDQWRQNHRSKQMAIHIMDRAEINLWRGNLKAAASRLNAARGVIQGLALKGITVREGLFRLPLTRRVARVTKDLNRVRQGGQRGKKR